MTTTAAPGKLNTNVFEQNIQATAAQTAKPIPGKLPTTTFQPKKDEEEQKKVEPAKTEPPKTVPGKINTSMFEQNL